jgi:GDPmannose 4,6-dehydratase
VIGTGVVHPVRDVAEQAFAHVGLDFEEYVEFDADLGRPADIEEVVADASKARSVLGWEPKVGFEEVISMMVDADLERLQQQETV